jgi:hypothetical protein
MSKNCMAESELMKPAAMYRSAKDARGVRLEVYVQPWGQSVALNLMLGEPTTIISQGQIQDISSLTSIALSQLFLL